MPREKFVLCTVYIDEEVDDYIRSRAATSDLTSAMLFRRYLVAGIKATRKHPELVHNLVLRDDARPLIQRRVLLSPKVDDQLRVEAFDTRVRKADLIRRYVRAGMNIAQSQPVV